MTRKPQRELYSSGRVWLVPLAALLLAACGNARAAIQLRMVASGLAAPVYVTGAGDGSNRLFIVEQAGRIRILAGGALMAAPFLDIRARVRSGGETGLLGLAFHPRYSENGRFFVNYTRAGSAGLETVIAEFTASPASANQADASSERNLLTYAQPFDNHNGGMVAFGPDGFLYIASGDGGSGGDPQGNGQSLNTLLGKILRIDVDSAAPYGIPADNPFAAAPGRDEIYAYGLRNPWRFSFDRETGRLFAGDVGQNQLEEIDIIVRGGNYGWNRMEGTRCYSPATNCNREGLILPIHEYGRSEGVSVTGGYVYRGQVAPSLAGKYVYADFGSGHIWALSELSTGAWRNEELLRSGINVSSFGEDEQGELYLVDYGGSVRQVLSDGREPLVNAQGTVNAASFLFGAIAPGQIISLFGTGLGPAQGAGAQLDEQGRIARVLAEARVWIDEFAAPLFYAQSGQVNAQVPYGVAGRPRVAVQAEFQDALANAATVNVAAAAPALFAIAGGRGQGAILNSDLAPNSAQRPAARGSEIVLYATGEGQTVPTGVEGQLAQLPLPVPLSPVAARIGGLAAAVRFAGAAPGFSGLLQINVQVPMNVAPGNAVPVELQIGGVSSPAGITVAIN